MLDGDFEGNVGVLGSFSLGCLSDRRDNLFVRSFLALESVTEDSLVTTAGVGKSISISSASLAAVLASSLSRTSFSDISCSRSLAAVKTASGCCFLLLFGFWIVTFSSAGMADAVMERRLPRFAL